MRISLSFGLFFALAFVSPAIEGVQAETPAATSVPPAPSIATAAPTATVKALTIGVLVPVTGPYANFGRAALTGVRMAIEKYNPLNLAIAYEDSQNDPDKAVAAFNKLADTNHVDVLMIYGSAVAAAVVPLAEQKGIPVFSWAVSDKLSVGHPQVMRLIASGADQGFLAADYAKSSHFEKVSYFASQGDVFQTVRDGFLAHFEKSQVVSTYEFAPEAMDFKAEIGKAKLAGAKQFGLCLTAPQTPVFLKQALELYPEVQFFGCHTSSSEETVKTLQELKSKMWFIQGMIQQDFIHEFGSHYPDTSGIWVGAAFFDMISMFVDQFGGKQIDKFSMASFAGKCVKTSAFAKGCVESKNNEIYFEVPLGVTKIEGGIFKFQVAKK